MIRSKNNVIVSEPFDVCRTILSVVREDLQLNAFVDMLLQLILTEKHSTFRDMA